MKKRKEMKKVMLSVLALGLMLSTSVSAQVEPVIGMIGATDALADNKSFTFPNDTGVEANDLHVWFNQSVTAVPNAPGGNYGAFGNCSDNGTSSPEFDNGTVAADGTTTIRFRNTGSMTMKKWYWTLDGKRIGKIHRGSPMAVADVVAVDDLDVTVSTTTALASDVQPQVVTVIVAEPRLSIARVPNHNGPIIQPADDAVMPVLPHCKVIGAAYNFPSGDRRLLLRLGQTVFFGLGKETEGVIFERSCGLLGVFLHLQLAHGTGTDPDQWRHVDYLWRYMQDCGPVIGQARRLGIEYTPREVGKYRFRTRVASYALPLGPDGEYNPNLIDCYDLADDTIHTSIRVIDHVPTPDDIAWVEALPLTDGPRVIDL